MTLMKLRIDTTAVKWNKTIDDPMEAGTKNIFVKRKKEEEEDEDFHLKKSEKSENCERWEDEEDFDLKNIKVNGGNFEDGNDNVEIWRKLPEHPRVRITF